jgi:hypothetical protein
MQRSPIAVLLVLFAISACTTGPFRKPVPAATPTITQTPAPSVTPTASPTNSPTPTSTPVPTGPCDNPLLPLGSNQQWIYRITSGGKVSQFRLSALGVDKAANITARIEYTDETRNLSIDEQVICADGAIVNFPLLVMNMLLSNYLDRYIDSVHFTSVEYLPNYASLTQDQWVLGWETGYLTENAARLSDSSGGFGLLIANNSNVKIKFDLDGSREQASVPAGDFPLALKVNQDISMPVTYLSLGSSTGFSLNIATTQWYEPYVGLVRAQINSAVLFGKLTLPIESTLELVTFSPGN